MVRTKGDGSARKASGGKATRKALGGGGGGASSSSCLQSPTNAKFSKYAGGNTTCERPTPEWQKGIDGFLKKMPVSRVSDDDVATSQASAGTENSTKPCKQGVNTSGDMEIGEGSGNIENSQQSNNSSSSSGLGTSQQSVSPVRRNGIVDSDDED